MHILCSCIFLLMFLVAHFFLFAHRFCVHMCQWHGLLWFTLHAALESSYRISLLFLWLHFFCEHSVVISKRILCCHLILEDVWQVGSYRKWQCWGASSKCSRSWLGNFRGMYSCTFHCMMSVLFMPIVHFACRHFLNYWRCFVISSRTGSWSFARTMISSSLWELMNVLWMALSDLPKVTLSHYFLPQIIAVWMPWLFTFSSHYGVE